MGVIEPPLPLLQVRIIEVPQPLIQVRRLEVSLPLLNVRFIEAPLPHIYKEDNRVSSTGGVIEAVLTMG